MTVDDQIAPFGSTLQHLRRDAGIKQSELAVALGIARPTLANIEAGRERASDRILKLLDVAHPEWTDELITMFRAGRDPSLESVDSLTASSGDRQDVWHLGGPFMIERLTYIYLFEESRSPNEIIEIRRIRATADGARTFGLRLTHNLSPTFGIDQEALWGGTLSTTSRVTAEAGIEHWRRIDFGFPLRAGQSHEFALRTWVEKDPDPQTAICFDLTIPAREVSIQLGFHGTPQPAEAWKYGPLADASLIPISSSGQRRLPIRGDTVSAAFRRPALRATYGLAWQWS